MPTNLTVNGKSRSITASADTPLLWVLRDELALTGTKYGCGIGMCGACTVLMNGNAVRSCSTTVAEASGQQITTIEGLSADGNHPLQRAWSDENVAQCGYCQVGQIMNAAALLAKNRNPSDDDIDTSMAGNACRCGTYQRIRQAIHRAASGVKA